MAMAMWCPSLSTGGEVREKGSAPPQNNKPLPIPAANNIAQKSETRAFHLGL